MRCTWILPQPSTRYTMITVTDDSCGSPWRCSALSNSASALSAACTPGATTTFMVNGHETDQVHIARGTLQGDSLSPLRFIIALGPLLRWLHSGSKGNTFGSDSRPNIAANAYADNLGTVSGCPNNLAVQALKNEHFSDLAGLRPNVAKRAMTRVLLTYADKDGTQNPVAPKMLTILHKRLKGVTPSGKQPQFLYSHNDSYRYIVELTMTLMTQLVISPGSHHTHAAR